MAKQKYDPLIFGTVNIDTCSLCKHKKVALYDYLEVRALECRECGKRVTMSYEVFDAYTCSARNLGKSLVELILREE